MITGGATIFSLLCVNTSNNWLVVKEIEYYHHSRLTGHLYMSFLSGTAPKRSFLTQARRRSTQQSTRGESIQMAQWRPSTQMGGKKPVTPPGGSGSKTKMETSSWTPRCRKVVNLSDWNLKHFYYCSYCSNCEKNPGHQRRMSGEFGALSLFIFFTCDNRYRWALDILF